MLVQVDRLGAEGTHMNVDTMPDLLGLFLRRLEERWNAWLLEREIKWTRRNLELTEREIAEKLQAKRDLSTRLMNLELERRG